MRVMRSKPSYIKHFFQSLLKTGEVIALAGSTGQESTGVHLHFELWKDGYPIDPEQFIEFE